METLVTCHDFEQLHDCVTIGEIRALLRSVERYSPYYMFFLLRLTTGMRSIEAIECLTLYNLRPDCSGFSYEVKKPGHSHNGKHERLTTVKHREVVLDSWVASELRTYLSVHCRVVDGVFVSPFPFQRLFPFRGTDIVCAYWWKLKKRLLAQGFPVDRMARNWVRDNGVVQELPVYVFRPHILRHFACSIYYIKYAGKDVIKTMKWIKHSHVETTTSYLHTPESMGLTEELICRLSWCELLGFDELQLSLPRVCAPSQTSLRMY